MRIATGLLLLLYGAALQADSGENPAQSLRRIQHELNKMPAGTHYTVPPGIYPGGLWIRTPGVINMQGVQLRGISGRKAILVIEDANGPVTVNDFSADGVAAGALAGNLAGVRVAGADFDVTLNRARVSGSVMGILTDNRGGILRINDSVLGDTGDADREQNLSHVLYAGRIDELHIHNSTLRRSTNLGHLLKSRAALTRVYESKLLGLDGHHSRVIDLPCGGILEVRNSVLQSGSRADNFDMVSVGVEPASSCGGYLDDGDVRIIDSVLVFDRESSVTEQGSITSVLFNWQVGVRNLELRGNRLVAPRGVLAWQHPERETRLPINAQRVHKSRQSAGLAPQRDSDPLP